MSAGADGDQPQAAPLLVQPVQRHQRGADRVEVVDDVLAAEWPVALVFNGISHAVMMASPQDLEDFAMGFALSEGLIDSPADCRGIEVHYSSGAEGLRPASGADAAAMLAGCEVQLEIASHCMVRLKEKRRALSGRTGCGVCGIDSLRALDLLPEPVPAPAWAQTLSVDRLLAAFEALPARQVLNQRCGAMHAAGWASADGQLREVREDVGRHNALDKLIGALARSGQLEFAAAQTGYASAAPSLATPAGGFVLMSSRASSELVRKCARLQIPVLAAISAPTGLAVELAHQAGMQLWGFCRAPRAHRYA
jgi:FdhD protein